MSSLDALFRPRGVAVLGASMKELSIGNRVVRNLRDAGYTGGIYPVHPGETTICDLPAYAAISDVPGPVDLVNIALRADRVPDALEACGRAGVRAAIVHSSGFAEAGPEGAALEARVLAVARSHGIRLLGPNAQGVMNGDLDTRLYASFTFTPLAAGPVTILAQSGGIAELMNLHLRRAGVGLRWYASPGNASDVDLSELLAAAADDDGTRVILLDLESVRDLAAFRDAALRAARDKVLLVVKSGRTAAGARAVASHTGALATGDAVLDAVLDRAGALRMPSVQAAVQAATAFARQPLPRGRRTAVVSNAGGPGIVALDEACALGLEPASPDDATRAALKASQSPYATVGPLVDLAATAGPDAFRAALSMLLAAPEVDGLVLSMVTPFFVDCDGVADAVVQAAAASDKPVVANVITDARWAGVVDRLQSGGIPVFEFPEDAARAMAAMARLAAFRARPPIRGTEGLVDAIRVQAALQRAVPGPDGWLSQADAYALLVAAGIPAAAVVPLSTPGDLDIAARTLGFPLVLKADPVGLVHKSAAGAVVLGIADLASLARAAASLRERFPGAPLLAQRQVSGGVEAILGVVVPAPGVPLVMAGLGGVSVESARDVAFALAPLDAVAARRLPDSLRGRDRFDACPGGEPADLDALGDALVRLSLLASVLPEVREIDLNPVAVLPAGRGVFALDVRVRTAGMGEMGTASDFRKSEAVPIFAGRRAP
jgi:acetyltransferase